MKHLGWFFKLNLHPRHQECTSEAQKTKAVLSAYIYNTIYCFTNKNKLKFIVKRSLIIVITKRVFVSLVLKLCVLRVLSAFSKLFQSLFDLTVNVHPLQLSFCIWGSVGLVYSNVYFWSGYQNSVEA